MKYGISAFKDQKDVSLSVSKTDIFNRDASPTVMEYGLDKVVENEEIELNIGSKSHYSPGRKVAESIKIPPRENIRVVKIFKNPVIDS